MALVNKEKLSAQTSLNTIAWGNIRERSRSLCLVSWATGWSQHEIESWIRWTTGHPNSAPLPFLCSNISQVVFWKTGLMKFNQDNRMKTKECQLL